MKNLCAKLHDNGRFAKATGSRAMIRSLLKLTAACIVALLIPIAQSVVAQQREIPHDVAGSVASILRFQEDSF